MPQKLYTRTKTKTPISNTDQIKIFGSVIERFHGRKMKHEWLNKNISHLATEVLWYRSLLTGMPHKYSYIFV